MQRRLFIIFIAILVPTTALGIASLYFAFANFTQDIGCLIEALRADVHIQPMSSPLDIAMRSAAISGIIAFSLLGTFLATCYFLTKKAIVIRLSKEYAIEKEARAKAKLQKTNGNSLQDNDGDNTQIKNEQNDNGDYY